jgi:hypothetical protein
MATLGVSWVARTAKSAVMVLLPVPPLALEIVIVFMPAIGYPSLQDTGYPDLQVIGYLL